jgi:hypothetical protein
MEWFARNSKNQFDKPAAYALVRVVVTWLLRAIDREAHARAATFYEAMMTVASQGNV